MDNGASHDIYLHSHFRETYRDEYTSEKLPASWVQAAIHEELQYFNDVVWKGVHMDEVSKDPAAKLVGCRWVICNKNDAENPAVRARLVAQEVNNSDDLSFFCSDTSTRE